MRKKIEWRSEPSLDGRTWAPKKVRADKSHVIKNILLPAPVFEAHYADGTVIRMSFATMEGKPLNLDRGKRVCDRAYAGVVVRDTFERGRWEDPSQEAHKRSTVRPVLVSAFVEHQGDRFLVTDERAKAKLETA